MLFTQRIGLFKAQTVFKQKKSTLLQCNQIFKFSHISNAQDLLGCSKQEIEKIFESMSIPKYRGDQIWKWIYHRGAFSFEQMYTIPKSLQQQAMKSMQILPMEPMESLISKDGTRKWLMKLQDDNRVETVYIPEKNRGTLCLSSQVGCSLSCKFCHTGTQPLKRNLSAAEIVAQLLVAQSEMEGFPTKCNEKRKISNIVMMGQGEPLYNYRNVRKALQIIMDKDGLAYSKRRITLSTSGVVPLIERVGSELGVNLAISLHAASNDVRSELMNINKTYPLPTLIEACRKYTSKVHNCNTNERRLTFEYVLLKGINDRDQDAKNLVHLLKGIPCLINLIPFNPWPDSPYECSSKSQILHFFDILTSYRQNTTIRWSRGGDILAACGQLKSSVETTDKNNSNVLLETNTLSL